MAACIIRAIWSEAPPAPAATTISTGLVGSHATAGAQASTTVSAHALFANLFIADSPTRRLCLERHLIHIPIPVASERRQQLPRPANRRRPTAGAILRS